MAVLVDINGCDHAALDDLVKASVEQGAAEDMWRQTENPWARAVVEQLTARTRMDPAMLANARAFLARLTPGEITMENYGTLVEYLLSKYLSASFAISEAEFIAVRAALMGKIQANLEHDSRVTRDLIDALALLLPTRFAEVPRAALSPREAAIMTYGRAHAAENIRHVSEVARHRMATILMEHVQGGLLGQREGTWAHAQSRLFDEFGALNRDFRRIAVTEGGEIVNQGYVASMEDGRQVRRIEAYRGACPFCRSINGKTFDVVAPDKPDKDGDREVWAGKTNVGRSASLHRADGSERPQSELWWPAAGVQHPHCRGAWVSVTPLPAKVSPQFHTWLQAKLDQAQGRA